MTGSPDIRRNPKPQIAASGRAMTQQSCPNDIRSAVRKTSMLGMPKIPFIPNKTVTKVTWKGAAHEDGKLADDAEECLLGPKQI